MNRAGQMFKAPGASLPPEDPRRGPTMISWDRDRFGKLFPRLSEEMERGEGVSIGKLTRDPWRGYQPSAEDLLSRAGSVEEALEALDYLERVGEIAKDRADELRKKLSEKGLEGLGERRRPGFYFKKAEEILRGSVLRGSEKAEEGL